MPRKPRTPSITGVYHITNRGADKQIIFEGADDYLAFLGILGAVSQTSEHKLFAYCLMDNHFHLLVREGNESIGTTMKRVETRYAKWFNEKNGRSGPLFEGRFHSEPVDTLRYFCAAVKYIYRNPIKAGIVEEYEEYPYSGWNEMNTGEGKLIDISDLSEIVDHVELVEYCRTEREDADFFDYTPGRKKVTDNEIMEYVTARFGCLTVHECRSLSKEEQALIVSALKEIGASHRAISRVTGISRRLVDNR